MIITSDDLDQEILGTTYNEQITATAWRGGQVLAANLVVTGWSFAWDATSDQVGQGRCSLTVGDPEGLLAPWSLGDPLGPGGSLVQLAWASGMSSIRVPLGNWRIRQSQPTETWRTYRDGTLKVSGGGFVTLTLEEWLPASAALARIDGDAPVAGATALAELRRITADIGGIDASLSPSDVYLPPQYTAWPVMRTDAMGDLLDMLGARSRIGGDSTLQVVPRAGVGPVWTIQGGENGALISSNRVLNDTDVFNSMTSTTVSTDGTAPLVGRAYIESGPLAYGGPYGKVPGFHEAIATTPAGVALDAATTLAGLADSGTIDLDVACLAHPALQVQDIVVLVAATVAGDQQVTGRVVSKTWSKDSMKQMSLKVRVPVTALEMIAERARRG